MENNNNEKKRSSKGRQKIEIKKIETKSTLQVTFSKRRAGLFKKAAELTVLCGGDVAVIAKSPAGKVFAFGNPSPDTVIDRAFTKGPFFFQDSNPGTSHHNNNDLQVVQEYQKKYLEAVGELEREKERKGRGGNEFWWEAIAIDQLGFDELEQYMTSIEVLKKNVETRAHEIAMASASPSNFLAFDSLEGGGGGSGGEFGFDFAGH